MSREYGMQLRAGLMWWDFLNTVMNVRFP